MSRVLVVAGPVPSGPVWNVEVPTEGLPEWWRCRDCGKRGLTSEAKERRECWTPDGAWSGYHRRVPDGPFPAPVAVWQECDNCEGYGSVDTGGEPPYDSLPCPSWCEGCGGAVVATVQVLGPTHHADDFVCTPKRWTPVAGYCHPSAAPDSPHTPVGEVRRLDVPYPMERPVLGTAGTPGRPICGSLDTEGAGPCVLSPPLGDGSAHVHHGEEDVGRDPASFWWAVLPELTETTETRTP